MTLFSDDIHIPGWDYATNMDYSYQNHVKEKDVAMSSMCSSIAYLASFNFFLKFLELFKFVVVGKGVCEGGEIDYLISYEKEMAWRKLRMGHPALLGPWLVQFV